MILNEEYNSLEALAKDKLFTDDTPVNPNGNYAVSELFDFIITKTKISDILIALRLLIDKTYEANANAGYTNLEVIKAREYFKDLSARLDDIVQKAEDSPVGMDRLTQELKEYLANVKEHGFPVVEEGAVGTVNLKDKSVIYQKIGDKAVAIDKLSEPLQHAVGFEIANLVGRNIGETLYQWSAIDVSNTSNLNGEYYSLIPTVDSNASKLIRTTTAPYVTGHKYYVKVDFRTTKRYFTRVQLGIYPSGADKSENISTSYPSFFTWETLDGVITAEQNHGDLRAQLSVILDGTQTASTLGSIQIKNIVVADLTECFGAGKEPSAEKMRELTNSVGGHFIKTTTRELANLTLKDTPVEDKFIRTVNTLPVNPNRFDDEVLIVFDEDNSEIVQNATGLIERKNNRLSMQAFGDGVGQALIEKNLGNINLENCQYIEVEYYTDVPTKINNFAINIRSNGTLYYGRNQKSKVTIDEKPGKRRVRMHLSELVDAKGKLTNATHLQFTINGVGAKLELISIKAIKQSKGTVYFYFDDASLDQYTNGFRIMEKYGLRGTIAVPTKWVGQSFGVGGKKVEWSHLREMQQAGWLIAGHGWDEKSLATLSDDEAYENMKKMSDDLFSRGFYFGSKCMISPQGSFNANTLKMARKVGLHLVRTNGYPNGGVTGEFPQSNPHYQNYRSPTASRTVEEVKSWIDEAIATGKETAIAWHVISDEIEWEFANTVEYFEEVVKYAKQKQDEGVLRVVTWEDTMLQSRNTKPIDADGNVFLTTDKGVPTIVDLRE